jgi:transposase
VAARGALHLAADPRWRDASKCLSATQLAMLLDGLKWTRVTPKPVKPPAVVG